MRPIAYSLQFRGRSTSPRSGRLHFSLSAPSTALVTTVGADGVHSVFEEVPGAEATFEGELALGEQSAFDDFGTIEFGRGNRLRFHSVGLGRLGRSPDPHLRHGRRRLGGRGWRGALAGAREGASRRTSSCQRHQRGHGQSVRADLRRTRRGEPRSEAANPRSASSWASARHGPEFRRSSAPRISSRNAASGRRHGWVSRPTRSPIARRSSPAARGSGQRPVLDDSTASRLAFLVSTRTQPR